MIAAATPAYVPYLAAAGVVFAMVRRIRANFGRQPWRPTRTKVRVAIVGLVLAGLVTAAVLHPARDWGVAFGVAAGVGLGLAALHLMRIEGTGAEASYTPDPWIGAALTLLLVGRIVWRFASGGFTQPQPSSPLTLAIAAMVCSFYLVQGLGLIRRMRLFAPPVAG